MTDNLITGIYPGTFDPVTLGHLDIIQRASHIVNKLIISVAENKHKEPFFDFDERIIMIKDSLKFIDTKKTPTTTIDLSIQSWNSYRCGLVII